MPRSVGIACATASCRFEGRARSGESVVSGPTSMVCGPVVPWSSGSVLRAPWSVALFAFALLWWVTRLLHEASPIWGLTSWLLAAEVAGLTLLLIRCVVGPALLAQLAFPICFFFVAVPWPSPIEGPLIQSLARANAAVTVEALGWFGIPAIEHRNAIEVGTGIV